MNAATSVPVNINTKISGSKLKKLENDVSYYNKSIDKPARPEKESMGKDDFLKLLVTQLSKQDPLDPVKNKEFIAQMAQFSSLEQMHNVGNAVNRLSANINRLEAQNFIGKHVSYTPANLTTTLKGEVDGLKFTADGTPLLMIGREQVDPADVNFIHSKAPAAIETEYNKNVKRVK